MEAVYKHYRTAHHTGYFYNFVTQLCNKFQEFNGPFIITQGGPLRSTTLVSLLVYNNAFKSYDMGMASAIAWLLFLIIMVFTAVAFISQKTLGVLQR